METLEQTTEFVAEICELCNNPLSIPKHTHEQIIREGHEFNPSRRRYYEGFFVSPCGIFYCNEDCYLFGKE